MLHVTNAYLIMADHGLQVLPIDGTWQGHSFMIVVRHYITRTILSCYQVWPVKWVAPSHCFINYLIFENDAKGLYSELYTISLLSFRYHSTLWPTSSIKVPFNSGLLPITLCTITRGEWCVRSSVSLQSWNHAVTFSLLSALIRACHMLAVIRLHAFVGMVDGQEYVGSLDNFLQSPDMYLPTICLP